MNTGIQTYKANTPRMNYILKDGVCTMARLLNATFCSLLFAEKSLIFNSIILLGTYQQQLPGRDGRLAGDCKTMRHRTTKGAVDSTFCTTVREQNSSSQKKVRLQA